MSPDDLAAKGTESGSQKALFAFAAMARMYGFAVAFNMEAYHKDYFQKYNPIRYPVPALEWLHAIPNGGERSPKTAALMKAEGVRKGVADVFLPKPKLVPVLHNEPQETCFHGLYIEMKKDVTSAKQSDEQKEFERYVTEQGYEYKVCRSWREAANVIVQYLA